MGAPFTIERFEYQMWGENAAGFYQLTLVFCNTPLDVLGGNFEFNYGGNEPVIVYRAAYEFIETTTDCWAGFDLDPAFWYDGESNLLVEILWADDEDHAVYTWGRNTGGATYVSGAYDSPTGDIYSLGLRMKLVGDYGPSTVEPASLGRVKVVYR